MKQLSIEEKAKVYDEVLSVAQETYTTQPMYRDWLAKMFPELVESENERIRKGIIRNLQYLMDKSEGFVKEDLHEKIVWLEKQRDYNRLIEEMKKRKELLSKEKEKATSANDKLSLGGRIAMLQELLAFNICNTTYNVEPKFKVGDWVISHYSNIAYIKSIDEKYYILSCDNGSCERLSIEYIDRNWSLWTIQDAKDGDVLAYYSEVKGKPIEQIGIFKQYVGRHGGCSNTFLAHTGIDWDGDIIINGYMGSTNILPATKEQRELLFEKMKQAGYEWDSEKKELRKIGACQLSENPCSNCTNTKGCITCVNGDQKSTSTPKILYSDEVIEWLDEHVPTKFEDMQNYVNQFKEDFGL